VGNEDLIWNNDLLGSWLRFVRMDRGYSQAELAALCGVVQSEIHRIEVGQRECRMETLVKLCGPLGIAPGWILDRVTKCSVGFFAQTIKGLPEYKELVARLNLKGEVDVAGALASACILAGVLLRSSLPLERLDIEQFPHEGWKEPFAVFALRLSKMGGDSTERASILHNLIANPMRELSAQGLIVERIFKETAKVKGQFSWQPGSERFPREIKWG
jgi:transcriptional regulator with XRE-family HTH domain